MEVTIWFWVLFNLSVLAMLALDLGVFLVPPLPLALLLLLFPTGRFPSQWWRGAAASRRGSTGASTARGTTRCTRCGSSARGCGARWSWRG